MTSEGNGWYVYKTTETLSAKVIFNGSFGQEPGQPKPGYDVQGEVWYENGKLIDNPNPPEEKDPVMNSLAANKVSPQKVNTSIEFTANAIEGKGTLKDRKSTRLNSSH